MTPEFATALVRAQTAVSNVAKDAANPHFRSRYASLAVVRDAVYPAFNSVGIAIIQTPHTGENGAVSVETILIHESGEIIDFTGPAVIPSKPDAQGVGSCITYLRRYNLLAITGIAPADEDDDGNAASIVGTAAGKKVVAKRATPPKIENGKKEKDEDSELKNPAEEWLRNSVTIVQNADSLDKLTDWWSDKANQQYMQALSEEDLNALTFAKDNRKTYLENQNG
jgi:hypothetical protein